MDYYKMAIEEAQKQSFTHEVALSNELAGSFFGSIGYQDISKLYLVRACHHYAEWGAIAKVNQLKTLHPGLDSWVKSLSDWL